MVMALPFKQGIHIDTMRFFLFALQITLIWGILLGIPIPITKMNVSDPLSSMKYESFNFDGKYLTN